MSTSRIVEAAIKSPADFISIITISNPNHLVKFIPEWDPIFKTAFGVEDDIALWTNLGLIRDEPAVDLIKCIKINTETGMESSLNEEFGDLTYSDFEKVAGTTYHTLKSHIKIKFMKGGKVLLYDSTTPVALKGEGLGSMIPIRGIFFGIPIEITGGGVARAVARAVADALIARNAPFVADDKDP
jgi:hypothetical protein